MVGLFTKPDSAKELASLASEWRGRLSGELWTTDERHQAYVETAETLIVELAQAALRTKAKQVLPAHIQSGLNQLLPEVAPVSPSVPTLADSATTAYYLSSAEKWDELDHAEVARLASQGWDDFRIENPQTTHIRFRSGTIAAGLAFSHATQPEDRRIAGFNPLGRYTVDQPAYGRLQFLENHFCTMDVSAFFDLGASAEAEYRWNHARSWHLGVSLWVLESSGCLTPR